MQNRILLGHKTVILLILILSSSMKSVSQVQGELTVLEEIQDGIAYTGGTANLLVRPQVITVSPDGDNVYVASFGNNGVTVFSRAADGKLTVLEEIQDGVTFAGGTANFLAGANGITISPDGNNAYVASSNNSSVTVFSRAADGKLTVLEEIQDGVPFAGGTANFLRFAHRVIVSPDGKNVYVVSNQEHTVTVFSRAADGKLTVLEEIQDGVPFAGGTANLISGLVSIAISSNGKNIYVTAGGDNAVTVFSRATVDGRLTVLEEIQDGVPFTGGTANLLASPREIIVSANDSNVYVAAQGDNSVTVFSRAADGKLTVLEEIQDGVPFAGGTANFLAGDWGINASADGENVYVAARGDNSLVVFSRAADGKLTVLEEIQDGVPFAGGTANLLAGAGSVTLSPDDKNVYVTADNNASITVFRRLILITAVDPVPTMSQWGLIVFGLLIMNISVFFVQRREVI